MKKNVLSLLVILLCMGSGLTMTSMAQEPAAYALEPIVQHDTPEVIAELEKARKIAGDDKYLTITEQNQCWDIAAGFVPLGRQLGGNAEPTKVFDNVYYIGGTIVGGWLITTSDGYILLDAMFGNSPEETIIPGMKKFGLDPAKIKYVLITHTGPDHIGGAKYFQEKYGAHVVTSAQEWKGLLNPKPGSWQSGDAKGEDVPEQESTYAGSPKMDMVGTDGQKLTLGDTTITIVYTPRQINGGGLSYIIPVFDNGEPHMWGTYGNNGLPKDSIEAKKLYRESVAHFLTYADAAEVDVFISSHPFVDGSVERMKELKNRKPGEPNPFVIGQEDARRYLKILDQCAVVSITREKAGLDNMGRLTEPKKPRR